MITKEQLIESLMHECAVIKHLGSKVSPAMLDRRPGEKMRCTIELLQYLTYCGVSSARAFHTGNWEASAKYREQADKVTLETFSAAIDRQAAELKEIVSEMSDADFLTKEIKFPWGGEAKLGQALINSCLKILTAYRMQLFIYLKSFGCSELNTSNCWRGVDAQMP